MLPAIGRLKTAVKTNRNHSDLPSIRELFDLGTLFISGMGNPVYPHAISHEIGKVTDAVFGRRICTHEFRHATGSSIAKEDPEHVGIVPNVLGHADYRTSESYYIFADDTRFPPGQWKSIRTSNAIERLHEEFKRRIKTQTVLPCAESAAMLFWALLASGQITMRKVDGWQSPAEKPDNQSIDLAA